MKKASEYRSHGEECRRLAAHMAAPAQRDQLLEMAAHWDKLAKDRIALIRLHPELATTAELEEEVTQPA